MFMKHSQIAPARISGLLQAAEAAARAIPPAFPLEATVAVNPFLGQAGEDLATAAARLARIGGVALTRPRGAYVSQIAAGKISDDDLAAALTRHNPVSEPGPVATSLLDSLDGIASPNELSTVADLAADVLARLFDGLREYEIELSSIRRTLHDRIDTIQGEIARRYRDGEASVDALLQ